MITNSDISVIILVYNQPELLEYSLWQMVNADYITPNIVVVDDASSLIEASQQQTISNYFGAKYIYEACYPKKFRKSKCALSGLSQVSTEFVGILDVHGHYDKDYLLKCFNVVAKYKNVVMAHHWFYLDSWLEELRSGKFNLCHLDMTKHIPPCNCIDWRRYSKQHDIKPSDWGIYADGNFFYRTEVASKCYDDKVYGYANFSGDISYNALYNNQSVVVMGDIHGYHIKHNKISSEPLHELREVRLYINKKNEDRGQLKPHNGLELI